MRILEGKWYCTQCNTDGHAGRLKNCPNCGDPRNPLLDPEEKPYLPTDAAVITDEAGLAIAAAGPDWNCRHCGHASPGNTSICQNQDCKRPRDTDDDVRPTYTYVDGVSAAGVTLDDPSVVEEDEVAAVLQSADPLQALADGPTHLPNRTFSARNIPRGVKATGRATAKGARLAFPDGPRDKRIKMFAILAVCLVLASLGVGVGGNAVYSNYFKTHQVTLTVENLDWQRQVEIERYTTLTLDDWSVPADGRIISSSREIHHYRDVYDHTEHRSRLVSHQVRTGSHDVEYVCGTTTVDLGNGMYSEDDIFCTQSVDDYETVYETEFYDEKVYRKEAVYQTKYVYQVDRWTTYRFVSASGETDPYWPETGDLSSLERVGDERRQQYNVTLVDPSGRDFNKKIGLDAWQYLSEGETVTGDQTRRGALREVDWPSS